MNKYIIVGGDLGAPSFENSMKELIELVKALDGVVIDAITQKIKKISVTTFIGKGKLVEIRDLVKELAADVVVFNHELSGSQIRNIVYKIRYIFVEIFAEKD